jgi:methionine-rich copper-binding protein CopC
VDTVSRRARPDAAALGGLLCAALVLMAGAAWAHAFPDHSEPRVGSTVDAPPGSIRIWFDGQIEPIFSTIRVENAHKQRVDRGDGGVDPRDNRVLAVDVPPLPSGRYRVYWSVVARDGHRTEGDFPFRIK